MAGTDVLVACVALVFSVGCGLLAHEFSHAIALRLAGIEYDVVFGPDRDAGGRRGAGGTLVALSRGPWAVVIPRPTGREPAWHLRAAALMPLAMTIPVVTLAVALDPFPAGHPAVTTAAIGWLACAIPSPQDFSVAFYAHRVLASGRGPDPDGGTERNRRQAAHDVALDADESGSRDEFR